MFSDEEIFFMYGRNAVVSRKGRFTLVHLDRPSADLVHPDEFFSCGCRVCQLMNEGGVVVFDDLPYEDEDILLE